jgi:two-component system NtrC family sensor kinase
VETARCPARPESADAEASPHCVVLRVADNGPGIPPELRTRIFEPFFTTKEGTGTGLGLWVSDTIVTKHGGSIDVVSQSEGPTHGTTFEITLPIEPHPQE